SHGANVINLASTLMALCLDCDQAAERKIVKLANRFDKLIFEEHVSGTSLLNSMMLNYPRNFFITLMKGGKYSMEKLSSALNAIRLGYFAYLFQQVGKGMNVASSILEILRTQDENPTHGNVIDIAKNLRLCIARLKKLVTQKFIDNVKAKKVVKYCFLLACPVDCIAYSPQKKIMPRVYNIYSHGDVVQRVLGIYQRTYSHNMCHIINIPIAIKKSRNSDKIRHPHHDEIHSGLVGKHLMDIPNLLTNRNSNFDEKYYVEFYEDFHPPRILSNITKLKF
ncbi:hypothetical protein ACFLY6_03010, partial [Candidatus Dependentiae bacterium]